MLLERCNVIIKLLGQCTVWRDRTIGYGSRSMSNCAHLNPDIEGGNRNDAN